MIAARQIAFGKAAGAKKPYDAEIEYLESTGTQYIKTGMIPSPTCKFVIDAWFTNRTQFGSLSGGAFRFHAYYPFCVGSVYIDNGATVYPYGRRTVVTLDNKVGHFVFDDIDFTYTSMIDPNAPEFFLFARNLNGNANMFDVGAKIYAFDWWNDADEEKSMSLIPVRKGNIGYMYDRVSGQLFGNQGTGEFVLGPDLIDYTAKDYVQDGIIWQWDVNGGQIISSTQAIITNSVQIENTIEICVGAITENVDLCRIMVGDADYNTLFSSNGYPVQFAYTGSNYYYNKPNAVPGNFIPRHGYEIGKPWCGSCAVKSMGVGNTSEPNGAYYKDGVFVSDIYGCSGMPANESLRQTVAYYTPSGKPSMSKFLKSVRVYSRALTAEEIAHNYTVDKARFGL